ncbi:MAG: glycosyltransferase family 2 protein [Pseudomonadota bacterium]
MYQGDAIPGTGRPVEAPIGFRTAIIIPCYNEAETIGGVIAGFRAALPQAEIIVCDNNSTDATASIAADAGAQVLRETQQGKGHAVARLFRDVEADFYVLVDGDMTYDADAAPAMLSRLQSDQLDTVVAARRGRNEGEYRFGHSFGNRLLTGCIRTLFNAQVSDMLSGYRVFTRRFVKSFPVSAKGFEIETELTVHMLELGVSYAEMDTRYVSRPEGSESKLNTVRDGFVILGTIGRLLVQERPIKVFGTAGAVALAVATVLFLGILDDYLQTGVVNRLPTLLGSAALGLTGVISIFTGLILAGVTTARREVKRLAFLRL